MAPPRFVIGLRFPEKHVGAASYRDCESCHLETWAEARARAAAKPRRSLEAPSARLRCLTSGAAKSMRTNVVHARCCCRCCKGGRSTLRAPRQSARLGVTEARLRVTFVLHPINSSQRPSMEHERQLARSAVVKARSHESKFIAEELEVVPESRCKAAQSVSDFCLGG